MRFLWICSGLGDCFYCRGCPFTVLVYLRIAVAGFLIIAPWVIISLDYLTSLLGPLLLRDARSTRVVILTAMLHGNLYRNFATGDLTVTYYATYDTHDLKRRDTTSTSTSTNDGMHMYTRQMQLGFSNASLFCRGPVRFLSLDGISFARPVPIGSILRLESMILHTAEDEAERRVNVHVGVKANVVDVKTGLEQTTNDFRFTWYQDKQGTQKPRMVVPKTYQEAMLWLEGKRALELGARIRGSRK